MALAASAALVAFASAAVAQDDDGPDTDDQIVITGSLVVPAGETVQHAVIFNGTATIEGTVARSRMPLVRLTVKDVPRASSSVGSSTAVRVAGS